MWVGAHGAADLRKQCTTVHGCPRGTGGVVPQLVPCFSATVAPALSSTEFVPGGMEHAFQAAGLTFSHAVEPFTAQHATVEERHLPPGHLGDVRKSGGNGRAARNP